MKNIPRRYNEEFTKRDGSRGHLNPLADIHISQLLEGIRQVDDQITASGIDVDWQKAIQCPCMNQETGKPRYDCTFCEGLGYRYLHSETVRIMVMNRNSRKDLKTMGYAEIGECTTIWPSEVFPGDWDKFTDPEEIVVVSNEILVCGEQTDDGISLERTRYKEALSVEICVDEDGKEYREGINFRLVNDRYIEWMDGPENGKKYSIRYLAHPEYVIMHTGPVARIEGKDALPYRAMAKRLDYVQYA